MDTSTPLGGRRSPKRLDLTASPVESLCLSLESVESAEPYTNPMDGEEEKMVSNVVEDLNLTPPKVEPKLLQLVKQTIAATEYFGSVEFRRKTCSKRTRTTSALIEAEDMEIDGLDCPLTEKKNGIQWKTS